MISLSRRDQGEDDRWNGLRSCLAACSCFHTTVSTALSSMGSSRGGRGPSRSCTSSGRWLGRRWSPRSCAQGAPATLSAGWRPSPAITRSPSSGLKKGGAKRSRCGAGNARWSDKSSWACILSSSAWSKGGHSGVPSRSSRPRTRITASSPRSAAVSRTTTSLCATRSWVPSSCERPLSSSSRRPIG
jgi:hypothetical protein